jgi:subtilisin family serine protease
MRRPPVFLLLAAALALVGASAQDGTAPSRSGVADPGIRDVLEKHGTARVLIAFEVPALEHMGPAARSTLSARAAIGAVSDDLVATFGPGEFTLRHRYGSVNVLAGDVTAAGLDRLLANPSVVRVDLDRGGRGQLTEAVPLATLDVVQDLGFTGAGVTVAVIDSGLDTDHPDLGNDLVAEQCFCSGPAGAVGCCPNGADTQSGAGAAEDDHGHGTNVTGIVTSSGTVAPLGGAPDAEIVAVKVLDSNNAFCCVSDVIAALDWLIQNQPDVDVVNMSLGTFALYTGTCDAADANTMGLAAAIDTLRTNGVLVFASAGNEGSGTQMTAPACVANAIAVGAVWDSDVGSQTVLGCTDATTAADQVTCFSNSDGATDLFAPGAPMLSTGLAGGTSTFFGTSQASPLAAACAALLLEADPTLAPAEIEAALEASPTLVTDATNGLSFPRLDCRDALDLPPVARCRDVTVPTDPGVCVASVADVDDGSSDPEGGAVVLDQQPPGPYALGITAVVLTVTDSAGQTDSCSATVTVVDEEAPTLAVSFDPDALWPPNHTLWTIHATVDASDNCDPSPQVRLLSVVSDEPDDGVGDGSTTGDVQGASVGTDDREFQLRAERQGGGDGRVYTATYEVVDASGNPSASQSDVVTVPKSHGN